MISSAVSTAFAAPEALLVFPSEVAARFWRRWLVSRGGYRALLSERCLSWDSFKERYLSVRDERRPASRLVRTVFAARLLSTNEEHPFLASLIDPAFASYGQASAAALARSLPSLDRIVRHPRFRALGERRRSDFREIHRRYTTFLERNDRFEPEWELQRRTESGSGTSDFGGYRPVVFFPKLIDDFATFEPHLSGVPTVPVERIGRDHPVPVVRVYPDFRAEIDAVLERVETLLHSGVPPQHIVITAVEAVEVADVIASRASVRGIPFRVQAGKPLSEVPGGSIFERLDEVFRSRFAVQSVAGLILDRSVPWRGEGELSHIAAFGFASHCYSDAEWRRAFALAGASAEELRERYSTLVRDSRRLQRATSFAALRAAVRAFFDRQVDHARWYFGAERVYEQVLTLLDEAAHDADAVIGDLSPWRLFLGILRDRRYVPRSPAGAVTLYDYRVAAGTEPAYHFVVGAGQVATRIAETVPFGIRAEERELLKWSSVDRSALFTSAYTWSGETVWYSAARVGPRAAHIPVVTLSSESVEPSVDRDRWWYDRNAPPPEHLSAVDAGGLRVFLETGATPAASDFQRMPVPASSLAKTRPVEHLSPTSLETFQQCPFAFFLRHRLEVDTEPYGYRGVDARTRGTLYHRSLEAAVAQERPDCRAIVESVANRADIARSVPVWALPSLIDRVTSDVEWSLRSLTALTQVGELESEVTIAKDAPGVPLMGTVDLLVSDGESAAIVDYKTGRAPTFIQVWGVPEGADAPEFENASHPQLPFYALLIELARDTPVGRLAFLLPRDRRVTWLADPNGTSRQRAGAAMLSATPGELPRYIQSVWQRIQEGRYQCPEDKPCDGCRWRSVCRRCFVVRMPGSAS